ncbi:MAG: hypothetical protein PUC02_04915 [Bacteroidales bacterium]|nr:hypothetical protein [Bacteroidales bacterium]
MKDKGLHASMPLPQTGYPRYPHAIIIIIVISIYFKKDNIIILECGKKTLILSSTGSLRSHPGFPGYPVLPDVPVLPDYPGYLDYPVLPVQTIKKNNHTQKKTWQRNPLAS